MSAAAARPEGDKVARFGPPFRRIDPDAFKAATETIPALQELAGVDQWVVWRAKRLAGGRWTKVPCALTGAACDAHDPTNHHKLGAVLEAQRAGLGHGPGFVATDGDPYVLVDLDHVLDPATGEFLDEQAAREVRALGSYAEKSVSGSGVHVILRLEDPERRLLDGEDGAKEPGVEIYRTKRFFTFTGEHLPGTPDEIVEADEALQSLWRRRLRPDGPKGGWHNGGGEGVELPRDLPELDRDKLDELLREEPKFRASWNVRREEFKKADGSPDWSSYDQSLANYARLWSWPPCQVWALLVAFREEHGAPDDVRKALRRDYVERTVAEAEAWAAGERGRREAETRQEAAAAAEGAERDAAIARFVMEDAAAAGAFHGTGGHADRRDRDRRLAELAGAAGLPANAVRELIRRAKPIRGAGPPAGADLEELVARARESRLEHGHIEPGRDGDGEGGSAHLALVRARLGVPVRRVVSRVGVGKQAPIVALELELADGRRIHLGDGNTIQTDVRARAAFFRAGLPPFDAMKRAQWIALTRSLLAIAEPELAGDLDDAARLAELIERAVRSGGLEWRSVLHPKDGGTDAVRFYDLAKAVRRDPRPIIYGQKEGCLWLPWSFVDRVLHDNAFRSVERWSEKQAQLLLAELGWRPKRLQIVIPAGAYPPPERTYRGQPPPTPSERDVVRINAWTPPPALAAEWLEGVSVAPAATGEEPGDA